MHPAFLIKGPYSYGAVPFLYKLYKLQLLSVYNLPMWAIDLSYACGKKIGSTLFSSSANVDDLRLVQPSNKKVNTLWISLNYNLQWKNLS